MSTPVPPHDAQRELERRALRNVRGLVDKMDAIDTVDRRTQKRFLVTIAVVALVAVGLIVGAVTYSSKRPAGTSVTIEPAKPAPAKPAPPK